MYIYIYIYMGIFKAKNGLAPQTVTEVFDIKTIDFPPKASYFKRENIKTVDIYIFDYNGLYNGL